MTPKKAQGILTEPRVNEQWAFILPGKWTETEITWFRGATMDFRPDQIERVYHLARSWGLREGVGAWWFFHLMHRAVKKVLNNNP